MAMPKETRRAVVDLFRTRRAGAGTIEGRQRRRLWELIRFARASSPFYRELYAELPRDLPDFSALPAVTKPQLMQRFDDVVTDPLVTRADVEAFVAETANIGRPFLGRYLVATTSGTSGTPGVFLQDEFARTVGGLLPRIRGGLTNWYGVGGALKFLLAGRRYALLDVGGGPYAAVVAFEWARRQHPGASRNLRFVSVMNSIDGQVAELNEFRPRALGGYPSAILLLAREQSAGRLRIRPMFVILVGETVTDATRRVIEEGFGCRSYEEYGSTENGALAVQCREGWLHYSADWFVLEPVDRNYRPVPPGTRSHTVLVTNLMNRVMPFIRYDQGDSVLLKPEPCECGSAFPAMHVTGREDDLLDLPSKNGGGTVPVAPLSLVTVLEETPGVYRVQVIRTAPATLEIRLEAMPEIDRESVWAALVGRVRSYLDEQGVSGVELTLSSDPPKQHPRSGKYQQVIDEASSLQA